MKHLHRELILQKNQELRGCWLPVPGSESGTGLPSLLVGITADTLASDFVFSGVYAHGNFFPEYPRLHYVTSLTNGKSASMRFDKALTLRTVPSLPSLSLSLLPAPTAYGSFWARRSNPRHSCNLCHSCSSAGSLTHCTGLEIEPLPLQWPQLL